MDQKIQVGGTVLVNEAILAFHSLGESRNISVLIVIFPGLEKTGDFL